MVRQLVSIDDNGRRVGQDHPKARLTDSQVEDMRARYEAGGIGYKALARLYGVSRSTARSIVTYERRTSWSTRGKWVERT